MYAKLYIQYIGTEFATLQIRQHIRNVEKTSVDCTFHFTYVPWLNVTQSRDHVSFAGTWFLSSMAFQMKFQD